MRTLLLSFATLLIAATFSHAADDAKPRVLILGDSISIGYTPIVQKLMADDAVVVRPTNGTRPENCAGTANGVKQIDEWLKIDGGNFDVIHFNFGLHDLKREKNGKASNDPADPRQSEPEAYRTQLSEIVAKLKATNAKLIYATTTPVPEGGVKPHRDIGDPEKYNQIAREIMKEHGVAINDLYGLANPQQKKIMRAVNVHFTPEGSRVLAEQVVEHVRAALNE